MGLHWTFLMVTFCCIGATLAAPPSRTNRNCDDGDDCVSTLIPERLDNNSDTTLNPEFTTLVKEEDGKTTESTTKPADILLNIDNITTEHSKDESEDPEKPSEISKSEENEDELKEGLEVHDKPLSFVSGDLPEESAETKSVPSAKDEPDSSEITSSEVTSPVVEEESNNVSSSTKSEPGSTSAIDDSQSSTTTAEGIQDSKVTESEDQAADHTEHKTLMLSADERKSEDITASSSEASTIAETTSEEVSEEEDLEGDDDPKGYAADEPSLESSNVEEADGEKTVILSTEGDQTTPQTTVNEDDEIAQPQKYISGTNLDLVAAVQFLHYHDKESSEQCNKLVNAHWDYSTNLTEENKQKQLVQTLEYQKYCKDAWANATSFAWKSFNDTVLRRWFKELSILGDAVLSEEQLKQLNELKAEMKSIYSTAKVCRFRKPEDDGNSLENSEECNLTLEPDLTRIMTKSRDYDELLHAWKSWRDVAGAPIKDKYLQFVEISNQAARLNGFHDTGELWRESYESSIFEQNLQELWEQMRPLYENLHAYVRRKLISHYGSDKIKEDGPIPAHLLGNMWAQSWSAIMEIAQPFPGKPSLDITPTMEAKNMTVLEMFKISEEFFTSLGLKRMPEKFWKHSLIEKPTDREVICHASAWDFCNGEDFRIKQCTDVTMDDLITVHHEMGHIQYFLQYAKQPNVFREGANPGFHEAIGDVLALSVSTPMHLKSIGLLDEVADDPEGDLNFLMSLALDKFAFLPYGYMIDLWRWGLFSGEIPKDQMNSKWWELRLKYQGVCPPVARTENDFDPGAKYHIPGNVPYIRYFVSHIIQFQMHKALCDASGHEGPLHKCDIYRSQAAGQILSQVMELGSSEHWSEVMKVMTGGATDKMDARPILDYFNPLLRFLEQQNQNETLGWKSENVLQCPT